MAGVLQQLFGYRTNRKAAKDAATDIARLLGSKRVANQCHVAGGPFCPYKVPMHTGEFWCSVFVSDASYAFQANHKRPTAAVCSLQDLSVFIKVKPNYFGAPPCKCLAKLSLALGVPVYAHEKADKSFIEKTLHSNEIFRVLRRIDFSAISEFHMSQLQLTATSSLRSAPHCVEQARLFQELVVALFNDSQQRHKTQ